MLIPYFPNFSGKKRRLSDTQPQRLLQISQLAQILSNIGRQLPAEVARNNSKNINEKMFGYKSTFLVKIEILVKNRNFGEK